MENILYSNLRKNLASMLDKVNNDHRPMLITRQKGEPAVLMSLKDFQAYEETMYLMKSPKNMRRLDKSIQEINQRKTFRKELIDE